jgi:hypothetical protein
MNFGCFVLLLYLIMTNKSVIGYQDTDTAITCQSIHCSTFPPPQDGYPISQTGTSSFINTRNATCASGYFGNSSPIVCHGDSAWYSPSGCTVAQPCLILSLNNFTDTNTNQGWYRDERNLVCAPGANMTIKCQGYGTWSNPSGCYAVACSSLPPPQNGYEIFGDLTPDRTSHYSKNFVMNLHVIYIMIFIPFPRFATLWVYTCRTRRKSQRLAKTSLKRVHMRFNSTLGFPGEGPISTLTSVSSNIESMSSSEENHDQATER